jgi:hypothetical protein
MSELVFINLIEGERERKNPILRLQVVCKKCMLSQLQAARCTFQMHQYSTYLHFLVFIFCHSQRWWVVFNRTIMPFLEREKNINSTIIHMEIDTSNYYNSPS